MIIIMALTIFSLEIQNAARAHDLPRVERAVRSEFDDVDHITTSEAAKRASEFVWVDSREAKEFAVSHIPGAVRIDPDLEGNALDRELAKLDASKPVIVYCSVGVRSSRLARRISRSRGGDVRNLEGGIFAWTMENRPLIDNNGQRVTKSHGYNKEWGALLPKDKRAQ